MTYAPEIHDWRRDIRPVAQVFRAGGLAVSGGLTLGGAAVSFPEPGGRAELSMQFATLQEVHGPVASWTYSRAMNGAIFRIPIFESAQLVSRAALMAGMVGAGIPWSQGQPWGTLENWTWNPTAPVFAAAARGASSFQVDLSDHGAVLNIGHVIGFSEDGYDFAHVVLDIAYDDDVATVTVEPPLRRALTTDSRMRFRPKMLATCRNPEELLSGFQLMRRTTPGAARFVEALV